MITKLQFLLFLLFNCLKLISSVYSDTKKTYNFLGKLVGEPEIFNIRCFWIRDFNVYEISHLTNNDIT